MAITKERLEELIKEEKGCYILANPYTIGYIHLNKKYEPIIESMGEFYQLWVFTNNEDSFRDCIHDYNLFETKEEAEWYMKFGNITRTETLSLPTFELLPKELDIPFIRYNEELESFVLYELYTYNNEICVLFREIYDDASDCLFRKLLTKENYLNACELCRKLFLEEEG